MAKTAGTSRATCLYYKLTQVMFKCSNHWLSSSMRRFTHKTLENSEASEQDLSGFAPKML